jgi:meso-butanediol dehydrogenase / (S,S)-butanediol dehydrogenase / diacetyl reductase
MRVAIVTGAASGIGAATALRLHAAGYAVVAADLILPDLILPELTLPDLADGTLPDRDRLVCVVGDAASAADNNMLAALAVQRFGGIDVAVFNAGVTGGGPIDGAAAIDAMDQTFAVNVRGVLHGVRAVMAQLIERRGAVVVTASISGLGGDPGMWAYNSSKAAVINLVRALSIDLGAKGVRVNAVCPGPVNTGMTERARMARPGWHDALARKVPLGRWGEADEVASVIEFLASPAASFVNGVALPVDGGVSAGSGLFDPPTDR